MKKSLYRTPLSRHPALSSKAITSRGLELTSNQHTLRRLPSLRGLQAFDAVARSGNLTTAAGSLKITPSAVSHRIRGLEQELGVALLKRTPKGLRLTDAGRRYCSEVEVAFSQLSRATDELLGPDLSQPLKISLTAEIGKRWLMPRFHRFMKNNAEVAITMLSSHRIADLVAGEADAGLRYGAGDWPGVASDLILSFSVSPLCAPQIKEKFGSLSPAEMLASCGVLRDVDDAHDDWAAWLRAAGVVGSPFKKVLRFEEYSMAVEAAISGQALLLGYSGYVDAEIASGALVRPFDLIVPINRGYHLVYVQERLVDPRIRAFRNWVLSEA